MGTTNPLRGHTRIHNVGVFYITFGNLHDICSGNLKKVYLVDMANSLDLKTNGFDAVLRNITGDIKILESNSIAVEIKDNGHMQIFSFAAIVWQLMKYFDLLKILVKSRIAVQFVMVPH